MSCWEVGTTHLDALLTAGLAYTGGPLTWFWPELPEDVAGDYQRGEPWGPEAVRLANKRRRELTRETAGRVGAMLAAENRRSVDHRYDESEAEAPYMFTHLPGRVDPLIVLKAIACYRYQSCEHPEWEQSEAYQFCLSLECRMINHLPGYDDAPGWGIWDPKVFLACPDPA